MDIFDEIRNRIDLSEYVSQFVQLRRTGRTMTGLCPFHFENTPSFVVYMSDFHCFGCGAHGTVIDFVMQHENLPLWEAVEFLAEKAGIAIEKSDEYAKRKQEYIRRDSIAQSAHFSLDKAIPHLKKRGITEETAKTFVLGWSDKNYSIVIPIRDKYGRTVGFSERFLEGEPKYKNSRNDDFFNKAEILFNLDKARKHCQERLYIVEGYFDVMALWQMGAKGVVGTCRDSLTNAQAKLIKETVGEDTTIVLVPDRDRAGINSVEKNTYLLRRFCKNHIVVLQVPKGCKDANDALIQSAPVERWVEVSADMYMLKVAMSAEKNREKQYIHAKRIADHAENEMVKADMVDYLADLWQKDRRLVQDYIGAKMPSDSDKLAKLVQIDSLIESYSRYVSKEDQFVVTLGYPKLNHIMDGGVRPGEVLQFVARSGVGKTTWMVNVIVRILQYQRIPVIFFSLEQEKEPVFEIMMQVMFGLKASLVKDLFRDEIVDSVMSEIEKIRKNFIIVDQGGLTLAEMEELINLADMHIFEQPSRAVFIDYLGYIKHRSSNSYERTTEVAKELKEFAKRTNKAVFSLHQTSREGGGGWTPVTMTMARDSGVVEESADYLLGAWRPGLDPNLPEDAKKSLERDYIVGVMKNRRGPANRTVEMKYYSETRRIME